MGLIGTSSRYHRKRNKRDEFISAKIPKRPTPFRNVMQKEHNIQAARVLVRYIPFCLLISASAAASSGGAAAFFSKTSSAVYAAIIVFLNSLNPNRKSIRPAYGVY